MPKLIRITTVPLALRFLLPGQMKFMSENGFDVLMISSDGEELSSVIEAEQCRHIIVPMTRKITVFQDIKCLFQLIKIFRKEKPDIVHSHTPKAGLLGMLAAWLTGVRVRIHTVAGIPLMTKSGIIFQILKITEKVTYAAATNIWPNGNSLYQYILQHRLTSNKKLKVISKGSSNGIDLKRFNEASLDKLKLDEIKSSINYDDKYFYLLFMGRLVFDKGIVELVNVFKKLSNKYPYRRLLLVGKYEKDLDPLPDETVNEIETNNSIIKIDWTQRGEYYLHLANCFIFPSHREGFPNVLLQAGAMHLPVICSKIAGNIDLIEHDTSGLVFNREDEIQLYALIDFAINHSEKMQSMADNLQQIIYTNYKQEELWKNLLDQYQLLLKI